MLGSCNRLWAVGWLIFALAPVALAQASTPEDSPEVQESPQGAPTEEDPVIDLDSMEAEPEREGSLLDRLLPEESPVHIFGYGEVHYNDPRTGTMRDREDALSEVHRFVIGVEYQFSDRIHMEVELDFEHSFDDPELETAQITFDVTDSFHVRAGSLLVPMGYFNEVHEPPTFYSVERPQVDTLLIPTTWQEVGAGVLGSLGPGINYKAYMLAGLDAYDEGDATTPPSSNFSPLTGIRSGRTKTKRATTNDLAAVVRVEGTPAVGAKLGLSGYVGGADQDDEGIGRVTVTMTEADARLEFLDFEFTTEGVIIWVTGGDDLGDPVARTAPGSLLYGLRTELAYHLSPLLPEKYGHDLVPFLRWEFIDTQARVPGGFDRDGAGRRNILISGVAYYPHPDVAFKVDVEHWWDADDDRVTRLNMGIGWRY